MVQRTGSMVVIQAKGAEIRLCFTKNPDKAKKGRRETDVRALAPAILGASAPKNRADSML